MDCALFEVCGGCSFRNMPLNEYQEHKVSMVKQQLQSITQQDFSFEPPIFINDGSRRRASMAFCRRKKEIALGFNAHNSNEILSVLSCPLLTEKINQNLELIRALLLKIANVQIVSKGKKKKQTAQKVEKGDVWITQADNGLDVVLEFDFELNMEMRQIIFEEIWNCDDIARISHRRNNNQPAETIIEKAKPHLKIANREVYIPAGSFLQPSKQGEEALLALVDKYMGDTKGKIADLFCGVGTFSYPLAADINNKIIAVDSSDALLSGFRASINRQMIPNIEIVNKNLFKYPLVDKELKDLVAIVMDPPRAGAKEQVKAIASLAQADKPEKIVFVSCNPASFVRDANMLIEGGYELKAITMVDQFLYSPHSEVVALFIKGLQN